VAVFTDAERIEVWDRRQAGELNRSIGRSLGRSGASVRALIESTGGVRPAARKRCAEHLTLVDREEISRGLAHNESLCEIAQRLGRAPSTVSREVGRNGGRDTYRAHQADRAAFRRARRPKPSKLLSNEVLRGVVAEKLADRWSPQHISGWLQRKYRDDEGMHVSHETIYLSLFVQTRGALKRALTQHLRTRRANRRPTGARPVSGRGRIVDPVMISERPAEVADRAVPGHWEGDLVMGKRQTAIGTLVERHTRYVMLFPLPKRSHCSSGTSCAPRDCAEAP
jgi:IS30 family transposase